MYSLTRQNLEKIKGYYRTSNPRYSDYLFLFGVTDLEVYRKDSQGVYKPTTAPSPHMCWLWALGAIVAGDWFSTDAHGTSIPIDITLHLKSEALDT